MSYRDYCGICGESYDNDNLSPPCTSCGREVCYRCGSNHSGLCRYCGDRRDAAAALPSAAAAETAPAVPSPPPPVPPPELPPAPPLPAVQASPPEARRATAAHPAPAATGRLWSLFALAGLGLLVLLAQGTSAQNLVQTGAAFGAPALLVLYWLFRCNSSWAPCVHFLLLTQMAFVGFISLPAAGQTGWRPWLGCGYLLLASGSGLLYWSAWYRQELRAT